MYFCSMGYENELRCVVTQIKKERKTRVLLDNTFLSEGRKEQIVEKRKAQVRRQYGCSMDSSLKI